MRKESWDVITPQKQLNPYTATTEEINVFLGNFERDLNEFYRAQPESRQSWEWYLYKNEAITGCKVMRHGERERIRGFAIYAPNLKLYEELELKRQCLATLKDRRDYAKKQELKELERYHPDPKLFTTSEFVGESRPPADLPEDEIDVKQIPF